MEPSFAIGRWTGRWPAVFAMGLALRMAGSPASGADMAVYASEGLPAATERIQRRRWTDASGIPRSLELLRAPGGRRIYAIRVVLDVCGSAYAVCKPHAFESYFQEDGGFVGYRVAAGDPFTKSEHEPFTHGDYELLDRILRTPTHPLSDLPPPRGADVAGEGKIEGIDAITGATIDYYAREAVPGAFYTTHAVWYFVQRSMPPVLKTWTLEWLRPRDVQHWAARGETLKVWWALDHLESAAMGVDAATELAYAMLDDDNARIQSAAIRYLRRAAVPYQAGRGRSDDYARIDDAVKPDFLQWWAEAGHVNPRLDAALRADLQARASSRSPVLPAMFGYLERTGLRTDSPDAWKDTLRRFESESPSTFLRGKARQLAAQLP